VRVGAADGSDSGTTRLSPTCWAASPSEPSTPAAVDTSPGWGRGHPNIYQVTLSPDLALSTIHVGFHHSKGGTVDWQARGTLSSFSR
jgi:hypothetical protein